MSKRPAEGQKCGATPFEHDYADAYDSLYREKDYESECDLIEQLLGQYGDGAVKTILDLGCGTGNHVLPLARRGYDLMGVDRSESMLARAREKALSQPPGVSVAFEQGDLCRLKLDRMFDAVLMMFAVLGYQLENGDVHAAMTSARRHLRPGGLFLFDVWYGPAVLRQRPSRKEKVIQTRNGQIRRTASGELDIRRHRCVVHYNLRGIELRRPVAETTEDHTIRFFFPMEIDYFLETAGFLPVALGAFPDFHRVPDEETWNVLQVGRAVKC